MALLGQTYKLKREEKKKVLLSSILTSLSSTQPLSVLPTQAHPFIHIGRLRLRYSSSRGVSSTLSTQSLHLRQRLISSSTTQFGQSTENLGRAARTETQDVTWFFFTVNSQTACSLASHLMFRRYALGFSSVGRQLSTMNSGTPVEDTIRAKASLFSCCRCKRNALSC